MASYKALYRKYRPQTFDEVVDQNYVTQTLKNAIRANKISHAYLFNGPRGIGKTSIARIFAKAINCLNPHDSEPCCECDICKSIVDGSNPDIIEIDAASRTKVEQMRDTLEKVSFLPSVCRYKVYIIDEVHMLSQNSFNALLKTLEEPPAHVIFILCTTEVEKVIPTIRSRCQRFDFHLISKEAMEERLKYIAEIENINIDDDALSLVADASEGGMRDALSLLDQISSFSVNDTITASDVLQISGELSTESLISIASAVNVNDSSKAITYLDELISDGKDIEKITQGLISFFKDILVIKNIGRNIKKVGYTRFDFRSLCDSITNQKIFKLIDVLTQAMSDYKYSTNKRLYLELAIIKMYDQAVGVIPKSTPIKENTNASTREPYDPNKVYGANTPIQAEPKTVEVKKEETIEPKLEQTQEEPPVVELVEEPKQEEVVKEEVKEEKPQEIELDKPIDLFETFGDFLEVTGDDKKEEPVIEEPIKEVEPTKEEPVVVELVEDKNESDEDENVLVIDSFDSESSPKQEEIVLDDTKPIEEEEETPSEPVSLEENEPAVEETIEEKPQDNNEEELEDNKEYDVHIIENILNNSDKPFKESIIEKLNNAEVDTRGTDLHRFALLLDDGIIVASSRVEFILTFQEVGHCNLVMKRENYEGVKSLISELSGEDLDFVAIPSYLWKGLSDEYIIKYKENRSKGVQKFINLTYIPCPGLKNNSLNAQKNAKNNEEEERVKMLQDFLGDTLKIE